MQLPRSAIRGRTSRLIPSRFPPISAFDTVASADDLASVMELEGWTNDRIVEERLNRLPRDQWMFGQPNASIVMASFLHVAEGGMRFNSGALGAWYAGFKISTSIAEVAHHLRREAVFTRKNSMTVQYRAYSASLAGRYADIRAMKAARPELYSPSDYAQSQAFGEGLRAKGDAGIVYDSVRHIGGTNACAYIPKNIRNVVMGAHYEIIAPVTGKVVARTLSK